GWLKSPVRRLRHRSGDVHYCLAVADRGRHCSLLFSGASRNEGRAHSGAAARVTCTWGSQSLLQPPFEAAPRSTTETNLVLQSRDFSHEPRPPKGGCSQDPPPHVQSHLKSPKPVKHPPIARSTTPVRRRWS